ncbi:MAG: Flp pilus assembly protein CpaB, partial [Acidimicrobiales bacterium]
VDPTLPTVALTHMVANEPILDFKVSGPGGRGSLSAIIGEDMRAVAIRVNDVAGVGGFIVPGDYVDVMMTRDMDPTKPGGDKATSLLVQKLKVLGTDQNNDQQAASPQVVQTVTLEVKNQEAQKLILGMTVGKLSLTLRRAGETDEDPTQVISVADLQDAPRKRSVVRRASSKRSNSKSVSTVKQTRQGSSARVTVIRDGEREQVKVKKEPETQPNMAGGSL